MARKFFYDTGEQKVGPVTGSHLVRLRATGEINDDTWVRLAKSNTWRPLGSVDLHEEEEQEANPGLWRLLMRSLSWQNVVMIVALGIIIVAITVGVVALAWPLIIVLILLWGIRHISKP